MKDFTITPEDGMEAYEQTKFLLDNAQEILSVKISRTRRQEIQDKLGVSISKARKMLLDSRIETVGGQPEIPQELDPSMFIKLTRWQRLKLNLKQWWRKK